MKKFSFFVFIFVFLLLIVTSYADPIYVLINSDDGDIIGIQVSPLTPSATNQIQYITDSSDPSLKAERRFQKWDFGKNLLTVKSDQEIQDLKNIDKKNSLRFEARILQQKKDNAIRDIENGFPLEVGVDTAAIVAQIADKKAAYDAVPLSSGTQ